MAKAKSKRIAVCLSCEGNSIFIDDDAPQNGKALNLTPTASAVEAQHLFDEHNDRKHGGEGDGIILARAHESIGDGILPDHFSPPEEVIFQRSVPQCSSSNGPHRTRA